MPGAVVFLCVFFVFRVKAKPSTRDPVKAATTHWSESRPDHRKPERSTLERNCRPF